MAVDTLLTGFNCLTGSSDPDPGDSRTVYRVNGVVPGGWPYATTTNTALAIEVYQNGDVWFDGAIIAGHPADGSVENHGDFTYSLYDGTAEGNTSTVTIELQVYASPQSGLSSDSVVMDWNPDVGLTTSVSNVTGWTEQANSVAATLTGVPTVGTPPGGTATNSVVIGAGTGFNFTDLTHLPISSAVRTMQAVLKFTTGNAFYGGFGYGNVTNNTAFSIIAMPDGELAVDYGNNRTLTGITPTDTPVIVQATYNGTNVEIWIGGIKVFTEAHSLITGTTQGNIGKSFGGTTTTCEIYRLRVLSKVLSDAVIASDLAELNALYIGNTTVANHAAVTASAITSGGFTFSGTATNAIGFVPWAVTTSVTPPSKADILAGTGALEFGVLTQDGVAAFTFDVTTAASSTGYYIHTFEYDLVGGESAIVTSALVTTSSATSSPTSITPTSIAVTDAFSVGGTLATAVADQPGCTFTEIADTAGLFAVSSGGVITTTGALSTSGSPYSYTIQADNGNTPFQQAISISVSAATASNYTPDATATTMAGVLAIVDAWIADPAGTVPGGKAVGDTRVVQLTQPIAGNSSVSNRNASNIAGGIVIRGTGPYTQDATFPYRPTAFSHINGSMSFTNNNNIQLAMMSWNYGIFTGNTNSGWYKVSSARIWNTTPSSPSGTPFYTTVKNNPGCYIEECYFSGHEAAHISFQGGNTNFTLKNNYWGHSSGDFVKWNGGSPITLDQNQVITGNWNGRQLMTATSAHTDAYQGQLDADVQNLTFTKNFGIEGASLTRPSVQQLFKSQNGNVTGTVASQNAFYSSAGQGLAFYGSSLCEYNTIIYCEAGAHGDLQGNTVYTGNVLGMNAPFIGGWATSRYNVVVKKSTGDSDTSGTGGLVLGVLGNMFNSPIVVNTSDYPNYIEGFPQHLAWVDQIKPKVGASMHWGFGGQKVGAYDLMEDIFVRGEHPMNRGWPTAAPASREYAPIGTTAYTAVGSTYTGNYDANCNNV